MRQSIAAVVVLLLFAACTGAGGDATTTTALPGTTGAPATTAPTGTTVAPGTTTPSDPDVTLAIEGFSFGPQLTVSVGDVIEVINLDALPHTWTSTDGLFDSGTLSGDRTFTYSFDQAGEYQFFCAIHPADMRGSIVVED